MLRIMFEHVIVEFGLDKKADMFFKATACTVRRKGGEEVLFEIWPWVGGWTCSLPCSCVSNRFLALHRWVEQPVAPNRNHHTMPSTVFLPILHPGQSSFE